MESRCGEDEELADLASAWPAIEEELVRAGAVGRAVAKAFRVEVLRGYDDLGQPRIRYAILYDREDPDARGAANLVQAEAIRVIATVAAHAQDLDPFDNVALAVVSPSSAPVTGVICRRPGS